MCARVPSINNVGTVQLFLHLIIFSIKTVCFFKLDLGVLGAMGVWRRKNEWCSPLVIFYSLRDTPPAHQREASCMIA